MNKQEKALVLQHITAADMPKDNFVNQGGKV